MNKKIILLLSVLCAFAASAEAKLWQTSADNQAAAQRVYAADPANQANRVQNGIPQQGYIPPQYAQARNGMQGANMPSQNGGMVPGRKVNFNPSTSRNPTVSPAEQIQADEQEAARQRAAAAAQAAQAAAAKKAAEDAARKAAYEELKRKNPSWEVKDKIKLQGVVNKEVFINNKVYTTGQYYMGAKIVSITDGEVIFNYKGQNFTKTIK